MASFNIGDRVKVIGLTENDRTGEIIAKGDMPDVELGKVVPGKGLEPTMRLSWWKVKLDRTGEEKDFPENDLEKVLPKAKI